VPLDANELVREVLSLTYSDLVARRVTVQHELQEGLPKILGQRVLLQQVLLNLVANAVEAMTPLERTARLLAVKTQARGPDSVLISVADSGPGIDPEVAKRIFDAFFSTKPQGMGMGLSICRMIVEAHQGRLWLDAAVPQGAIFNLQLPTS
jgi:signal transduction histidine kinase